MKRKALSLQEQQKILYELLYTLDDFCKEYHIRYFLVYGSLLGAIRHHGIIPWDDDVDVMMEREQYERFRRLMAKHTPAGFKGYDIDSTKGYYYPFMKFGKLGTVVIERDWKCVPKKGIGLNIDIFPIDGCPNDKEEAKKYVAPILNMIFNSLRFWCNKDIEIKNFIGCKKLIRFIYYKISRHPFFLRRRFKKIYSQTQKYKLSGSKYFFNFWTFQGSKRLFPTDAIKEIAFCKFGDRNLPIPAGYDDILKACYGDYMTPPEDKSSTHIREVYIEV